MKKKSIIILIIVAIIGFLTIVLETGSLTSDYVMIYPKLSANSITITRPDSSCSWETGDTEWIYYDITVITNVDIELYKGGIFVMEVGACLAGSGALAWTIPSDLENSDQYQIKVIDYYNSSLYDISDFFEIRNPQQETPGIPGYNLYVLIGVISAGSLIGAICILVILKRKKHKPS
ncbi:MAG: Ser-Thr-rich GPI-anchored membrane family protein [Candidatus Hodarchaeota archaeon]